MIQIAVTGMGAITAVLLFTLLLSVYGQLGQVPVRTYTYLNNRLKEQRKGTFDYDRIEQFLQKNGAAYLIGSLAEPVKYLGLCVLMAALGVLIGLRIDPLIALPCGLLGAYLPKVLILVNNQQDNNKMLTEIKMVYQFIGMQAGAGVYLTDSLAECYGSVEHPRLKKGFYQLSNEMILSGDVETALDHFAEGFDNTYIDTLCIVIKQSLESGQAVELLQDIAEQVKEVEQNLLYQKQEKLQRKIAVFQLLFFAGIVIAIMLGCAQEVLQQLVHF